MDNNKYDYEICHEYDNLSIGYLIEEICVYSNQSGIITEIYNLDNGKNIVYEKIENEFGSNKLTGIKYVVSITCDNYSKKIRILN